MKKIIWTYGIIAGAIVSAMMVIAFPLTEQGLISQANGMLIGYTSMVLAFTMVFIGIKTYRDQYAGGQVSFGKAFRVGILITVVASVIYCLTWEACYHTVPSDFIEKYQAQSMENMKDDGASEAELAEAAATMKQQAEWYKNPIVRFVMTLFEILPVGLLITLVSAALLRRPSFMPHKVNV